MSDIQDRREPTFSVPEQPMYELLPHRRTGTGEGTAWTLIEKVTLLVAIAGTAIFGWHVYAHLKIQEATQAYADELLEGWTSTATATVEINPLSNFASIYVVLPPRSESERVENMFVDAIVQVVRTKLEPKLERDMELAARRYFDLYAMALPYRVSIDVEEAANPNRD